MKTLKKLTAPPWPALYLGIPALGFMVLLHRTGVDDRGLFIPGHFSGVFLWILTAAMTALTVAALLRYGGKTKYGRMFPPSTPAACGILAAAIAVLWSAWNIFRSGSGALEVAVGLLGLLCAIALVYLAWCRFRAIRGSFLLWCAVSVFLMMRLMFAYRSWSAQPELLHYCFPLLASVCVTLACYYRTAFAVGMGNRRLYLFFTQMGAFFCLVTLGSGFDLFYLGALLWCLLDLTSLRPLKTGAREELPEDPS